MPKSESPAGGEPRSPTTAGCLSVVPGLGQIYNGQIGKASLFFFGFLFLSYFAGQTMFGGGGAPGSLALLVLWGYGIYDAAAVAGRKARAAPPPDEFSHLTLRRRKMDHLLYLIGEIERWRSERRFPDEDLAKLEAEYRQDLHWMMEELGLRPATEEKPAVPAPTPPRAFVPAEPLPGRGATEATPATPPPPPRVEIPRPPPEPLTLDKLWKALLSERGLKAMLYLGALLITVSAVLLVVYNWALFPPSIQMLWLALITALFYVSGWLIRSKLKLERSGLTFVGIGAVLVPIDFYAVGRYGLPPDARPTVWLAASLVSLAIYALTVRWLKAEFFGYLAALALHSSVLSALNLAGVPADWRYPFLMLAAVSLFGMMRAMARAGVEWKAVERSMQVSAHGSAALLLAGFTLAHWAGVQGYLTGRAAEFQESAGATGAMAAALPLALVWAFGTLFYFIAYRFDRERLAAFGIAWTLPAAVLFFLMGVLPDGLVSVMPAARHWLPVGLAALVPFYLYAGSRLRVASLRENPAYFVGYILAAVAALWSLTHQLSAGLVFAVEAYALAHAASAYRNRWLALASAVILPVAVELVLDLLVPFRYQAYVWIVLAAAYFYGYRILLYVPKEAAVADFKDLFLIPACSVGWAISLLALLVSWRNYQLDTSDPASLLIAWLAVIALYGVCAAVFKIRLFVWLAAITFLVPFYVAANRGFYFTELHAAQYGLATFILGLAYIALGFALDRAPAGFSSPLHALGHFLTLAALPWSAPDRGIALITLSSALVLYAVLATVTHRNLHPSFDRLLAKWVPDPASAMYRAPRAAYLYLAVATLIFVYNLGLNRVVHFGDYPTAALYFIPLVWLLLGAGLFFRRLEPAYAYPWYAGAHALAGAATLLAIDHRLYLIILLAADCAFLLASTLLFRKGYYLYLVALLAPAMQVLILAEMGAPHRAIGPSLIALVYVYLFLAGELGKPAAGEAPGGPPARLNEYSTPWYAVGYLLCAFALMFSYADREAAILAYLAAIPIYVWSGYLFREPVFAYPIAGLAAVPYVLQMLRMGYPEEAYGVALLPAVAGYFIVARTCHLGLDARSGPPWPARGTWARWSSPFYLMAHIGVLAAIALSLDSPRYLAIALLGAAGAYGLSAYFFGHLVWAVLALLAAHFGYFQYLVGYLALEAGPRLALYFLPVTYLLAFVGYALRPKMSKEDFGEALWRGARGAAGRMATLFYLFAAFDVVFWQVIALGDVTVGLQVSSAHAALFAIFAFLIPGAGFPYPALVFGLLAYGHWLKQAEVPFELAMLYTNWVALGMGLLPYALKYVLREPGRAAGPDPTPDGVPPAAPAHDPMIAALRSWTDPLRNVAVILSAVCLVVSWANVNALAKSLALIGLLYLAIAVGEGLETFGYFAVAMILAAWGLYAYGKLNIREVQWYALPAGIYLLGVGYLLHRRGRREWAYLLDVAAMVLLLGTSFFQTVREGLGYALIMGIEGLLITWYGAARRVKRLFFGGAFGVVLDGLYQLYEPLLSLNRWIVLGLVGIVLVTLALLFERKREQIAKLRDDWVAKLEDWE